MTSFQQHLKDTLGRAFTFERELGVRGMSPAFIAIDRLSRRKVVIKFLSPELVADLDQFRFRREIQAATQLEHPHILPLLSAGEHKDLVWYTMPFVAGESLRSAEKYGPMPVSDVLRILHHVGEALDYAHGEGVVHRDINAVNVLQSGTHTLVTDFGVAKALVASVSGWGITEIGRMIGTPAYMAPEQLSGDPAADHRIDIYAVGLLAYELLKGPARFSENSPSTTVRAGWSQEPQPLTDLPPSVPQSLAELIMRCLSTDPDDRPATARDLLNALDQISTASGDLSTMENEIGAESTAPSAAAPVLEPPEPAPEPTFEPPLAPTPDDERPPFELASPRRNGKKVLAGVLLLILPIAAGAIFFSQRRGNESSGDTASTPGIPSHIESAPVEASPGESQLHPALETRKKGVAPQRALQARADSIQKARAEWAKLAATNDSLRAESARRAALSDSLRRAQETMRNHARSAAAALLANPRALESFMQGATHKGGLLGSKTKGDLQTQIDALQPFLTEWGLTYQQFKDIVKASGITLFDNFGRMVPETLQRIAAPGG
ncbi:MAG: serine/threonine protein kinase [Gemmatimonadaceae bacterium]